MKPAKHKFTVLKQICDHIPAYLVTKRANKHGVSERSRSYSPWSHVVSLIYAQLSHSLSLNDICDSQRNHSGTLATIRGATAPSRNGLSNANKIRDPKMAEELFWTMLEQMTADHPQFINWPEIFKTAA